MHVIQRGLLIAVSVVVFMWASIGEYRREEKKLQEQWEKIQTERFLKRICRSGVCTYEDYLFLYDALNYHGIDSSVCIEEYQKEQDMGGHAYYYVVSWEELAEELMQKNVYTFKEGNVIHIQIQRNSRVGDMKSSYFDVVNRKGRKNDS